MNRVNTAKFQYREALNLISLGALAMLMNLNPVILLFYFIGLNIYFFYRYFTTLNINYLIQLLLFMPSIELLRRLLKVDLMPYEIGKYMCFFYFVIFSLDKKIHTKKINTLFIVLFLFLFPSIVFMDLYNFQKKITFNLMGIINLSLLGIFFSRITISLSEFKNLFKNFIYSIIPLLIIISIKTPDLSDIEFNLGANTDASGGFGPNQVSTVLGSGIFVLIINQLALKEKLFKTYKLIDLSLIIILAWRALLTFSRGGIFSPLIALFTPIQILSTIQSIRKILLNLIVIVLLSGITFFIANNLTDGILLLRFSGENTKTTIGTSEKTLESISSGRASIFEKDLDLWTQNIIFGVGPGESPYKRMELGESIGITSHTEYSRLLAEHGLFGLVVNIMLIVIIPIKILKAKIPPKIKYIKLAFALFALLSMTHSAMRTVIPVIFYAFSAVNFYDEKKPGNLKANISN